MWQRSSYHEIADELASVSERFRAAEAGRLPFSPTQLRQTMVETSIDGIALLRALALAVRSEQDYGHGLRGSEIVGQQVVDTSEADRLVNQIRGIPISLQSQPLVLRDALNKIAHADPALGSYNVEGEAHDLVLSGTQGKRQWVAVISLPKVIAVLRAYPDFQVRK